MNIRDLRKDNYRTLDGQSLALLISSNFKKKLKNNNSISLELEFP